MSQMEGFEQTVTEIIYNEKAAEHLRYVSYKDIENTGNIKVVIVKH